MDGYVMVVVVIIEIEDSGSVKVLVEGRSFVRGASKIKDQILEFKRVGRVSGRRVKG